MKLLHRIRFWHLMVGVGFVLLTILQAEKGLALLEALKGEGYSI